jgi:hypothetical protein
MTSLIVQPEEQEIPKNLMCPISLCLMKDPVIASDGITYDRESIEKWLEAGNSTSPITRQTITKENIIPNILARTYCDEYREKTLNGVNTSIEETNEKLEVLKEKHKEKIKKLKEKEKELKDIQKKTLQYQREMDKMSENIFNIPTINGSVTFTHSSSTLITTVNGVTVVKNGIKDENGNINCTNCVGCQNCINCQNCTNCVDCTGCQCCINCVDCTGCQSCTGCNNCTGCMSCLNLSDSTGKCGISSKKYYNNKKYNKIINL